MIHPLFAVIATAAGDEANTLFADLWGDVVKNAPWAFLFGGVGALILFVFSFANQNATARKAGIYGMIACAVVGPALLVALPKIIGTGS